MTREEAAYTIERVIQDHHDAGDAAECLKFLLGEIRDLELERNKCELDAAHWKERYDDAVKAIELIDSVTGKAR